MRELADAASIGETRARQRAMTPRSRPTTITPIDSGETVTDQVPGPDDPLASLIKTAFEQAQKSGKPDWRTMHAGVLKNRLLLLDSTFDEANLGYERFTDLLADRSDLVDLDRGVQPPVVTLRTQGAQLPQEPQDEAVAPRGPWRVRSDLWSALLRPGTGTSYLWEDGALRTVPTAAVGAEGADLELPRIGDPGIHEWRQEFAEGLGELSPDGQSAVDRWRDQESDTWVLPFPLRGEWLKFLKLRVRDTLIAWFEHRGLEPPEDLVILGQTSSSSARSQTTTSDLRGFVVRCVEGMTRAELEALHLPAAAVFRAQH